MTFGKTGCFPTAGAGPPPGTGLSSPAWVVLITCEECNSFVSFAQRPPWMWVALKQIRFGGLERECPASPLRLCPGAGRLASQRIAGFGQKRPNRLDGFFPKSHGDRGTSPSNQGSVRQSLCPGSAFSSSANHSQKCGTLDGQGAGDKP